MPSLRCAVRSCPRWCASVRRTGSLAWSAARAMRSAQRRPVNGGRLTSRRCLRSLRKTATLTISTLVRAQPRLLRMQLDVNGTQTDCHLIHDSNFVHACESHAAFLLSPILQMPFAQRWSSWSKCSVHVCYIGQVSRCAARRCGSTPHRAATASAARSARSDSVTHAHTEQPSAHALRRCTSVQRSSVPMGVHQLHSSVPARTRSRARTWGSQTKRPHRRGRTIHRACAARGRARGARARGRCRPPGPWPRARTRSTRAAARARRSTREPASAARAPCRPACRRRPWRRPPARDSCARDRRTAVQRSPHARARALTGRRRARARGWRRATGDRAGSARPTQARGSSPRPPTRNSDCRTGSAPPPAQAHAVSARRAARPLAHWPARATRASRATSCTAAPRGLVHAT